MTSALLHADRIAPIPGQSEALASIDTLHALYAPRIFRFILSCLRDRSVAEDLTQETFLRAWSARDQFRGGSSAITWLTHIALNLVRDHTRTNRFRFWQKASRTAVEAQDVAAFLPSYAASSEASLIAHQQLAAVWQTVANLSERQRTVFLLRFVEELELADIAIVTGLPLSTVKTHLYRSLAAIRARHLAARPNCKESR